MLLIALPFFFSCNNGTYDSDALPAVPDSVSGLLQARHIIWDSTFYLGALETEEALAQFYTAPNSFIPCMVDSVSVNNTALELTDDSLGYIQEKSAGNNLSMDGTANWHVAGNAIIPSFTYNYPTAYPTLSVTYPDTINRAAGVTFSMLVTNADSLLITIFSDTTSVNKKFAYNPAGSYSFSAADLSSLAPTSGMMMNATVNAFLWKSDVQVFGGKKFVFMKASDYMHGLWVQ